MMLPLSREQLQALSAAGTTQAGLDRGRDAGGVARTMLDERHSPSRPPVAVTRRLPPIRTHVSESKATTEEVTRTRVRTTRQHLTIVSLVLALVAAPVASGRSQTPRPNSTDASSHAPSHGVERGGIGTSAPSTPHGRTRFAFAPDTLAGKMVDGRSRVRDHGEAKGLRGDEVKRTGDLRCQAAP
jgi:hypothetical protein